MAADREIDAAARIVAPGFIDSHTHDDRALLSAPDMAMKASQGVTTVVIGNQSGRVGARWVSIEALECFVYVRR